MAFSMFSVLPMPRVEWKKENMAYMLACLPLVGVVVGLGCWLWLKLCQWASFGGILWGAGLTVIPVLLTGGIHLDGFCDTADALASHASPERKREILKDSHTGAFAVIYAGVYFITCFALCTQVPMDGRGALVVGVDQVLARALGGLASVTFPGSGNQGLLQQFREGAQKWSAGILGLWAVLCLGLLADLSLGLAGVSLVLGLACMWYEYRMSKKAFGGMSGDLTGFLITLLPPVLLLGQLVIERGMV